MIPPFDEALEKLVDHYDHMLPAELIAAMAKQIAKLAELASSVGETAR